MNHLRLVIILLLTGFLACKSEPKDANSQIDEGTIANDTYTSKEIGWTIKIPKGFKVMSRDLLQRFKERGLDAIETAKDVQLDADSLKQLISFQKDQLNIFQSTSEPFRESYPGEYQDNQQNVNAVLIQTLESQGIKVDSVTSTETVQGLEFNKLHFKVYTPDNKLLMESVLYSRYHKGYDFGVNINYNNEKDKELMLEAFRNSRFQ